MIAYQAICGLPVTSDGKMLLQAGDAFTCMRFLLINFEEKSFIDESKDTDHHLDATCALHDCNC